jgi:hypothetical protein
MAGCPRCEDQHIVDPFFLEETKSTLARLSVELIIFCKKHKVKPEEVPALGEVAAAIRIIEAL